MPVAVARKIEHRIRTDDLGLDVQLRPIILDEHQCQEYRLPRTPIKESERRKDRFEERYGEGATELDALEALHPGELRRILIREISRYYDGGLDQQIAEVTAQLDATLTDINARARDEHADELAELRASYEQIVRRHNEQLQGVAERFNAVQCGCTFRPRPDPG